MALPTEHALRETLAFVRGPVPTNQYAYGTVDSYRGGVQHHGLLVSFPEPQDGALNDFGIQQSGGFVIEIADELEAGGTADWILLLEDGSALLTEDLGHFIQEFL